MNELQIFENNQFGQVRAIMKDGEPWFVAADVCRALEIANNRDALTRLEQDEKGVALTDTPGGAQEVTIVNERRRGGAEQTVPVAARQWISLFHRRTVQPSDTEINGTEAVRGKGNHHQ